MAIRKSPLIWTASLAAIAAGSLSACGEPAARNDLAAQTAQSTPDEEPGAANAGAALAEEGGEAGEGGEGGEAGGEFGIDASVAVEDPVVYISAIEVMRAHYLAGLAALQAGERQAAAAMFSHPVSEIYVDFEPVAVERGAPSMMEEMNRAAVLHFQEASDDEIREAVQEVLRLLDETAAAAPAPRTSQGQVDGEVILDLADRAALQYGFASAAGFAGESWLDAYGFNAAVQFYARRNGEELMETMPVIAGPLSDLLVTLEAALGEYDGPAEGAPSPQDVDAAVWAYRNALLPEGDEATAP
ncbi:hypothetical protein ACWCOP_04710 [Maricaulaceae bacterium MS644]